MNRYIVTLIACSVFTALLLAEENSIEKRITPEDYVQRWSSEAQKQMYAYHIPASITLAQGILESGSGNSPLAKEGNNHFGIKCHDWQGEKLFIDDDKKQECFRKYALAEESYKDHSLFLSGRTRYAKLFAFPLTDYKSWSFGLKDAGYATSATYPTRLIELIEKLELFRFDDASLDEGSKVLAEAIKPKSSTIDFSNLNQKHTLKTHKNEINYITARKGDTFYKISKEFNIGLWQLYKYNDYGPKKDILVEGDIVYLEPKRRKSREKGVQYIAKENVTLYQVSQEVGIKLKSLIKINGYASPDVAIERGQKVLLR